MIVGVYDNVRVAATYSDPVHYSVLPGVGPYRPISKETGSNW